MSIISALKTYIKTYTGLKTGAPVWVDYIGPNPTEYAIIPLPGSKIIEQYIRREHAGIPVCLPERRIHRR